VVINFADKKSLTDFLNRKVAEYNTPAFIAEDPVSVPHRFSLDRDIEIAGLFAAVFAWGNRPTIIRKTMELMQLMELQPYAFITQHQEQDLRRFLDFKHRTFNATDLLYFIEFLRHHYSAEPSLQSAFTRWMKPGDATVEDALTGFHHYFFSLPDAPSRTKKHIATPYRGSTCKRLNMFLRWMVRCDNNGVDFGIWKDISPSQLVCPVDLHVARVAQRFGLVSRKQVDWQLAMELTTWLRELDAEDPAKYDFALFGLGVMEKFR
jgi:uncharacterized protein (TIGR02757 family)